jgi:hypothetical protein
MIICKSNVCELADNLQFAIDHDLGLNLSPIVIYPVTEQLNCFSDFPSETKGWQATLDRAAAICVQAKTDRKVALARVDPTGMIAELRRILEDACADYGAVELLHCEIRDPHNSIEQMRRPAIIAYDNTHLPRAYVKIRHGVRNYVLKVPKRHIGSPPEVRIDVVHDIMEPNGTLISDMVPVSASALRVYLPKFNGAGRLRNIHWANYGIPTPDGNFIRDPKEVVGIYRDLYQSELAVDAEDLFALGVDERLTKNGRIRLIDKQVSRWRAFRSRFWFIFRCGRRALRTRLF